RGEARSSKFFRVLGRLHVAMLRGLPAPVDAELPVGVTAYDSTDHIVDNPHYDLSVDPPEAADVVSTRSVIPRKAMRFRVQAHSGSLKSFDLVVACQNEIGRDKFEANFVLKEFAGDGNPIQWIGSRPQLMQKSAFSDGFAELGPADLAHLTRPWGLVRVNLPKLGDGLLISDSGSARIRWVSLKGDRIVTVVGGGPKVATPTATTSPLDLELVAPAGLAFGKDFTPPGGTAPQIVAIVDRGRNQLLAWDINDNGVKVIAGTGAPTFTRQTATDSALVQNSALGDADLPKKLCGEATVATLWEPASVAILHKGAESIFLVADTNNNRIRRIVRKSSAALLAGEFADCTQTGIATFSGVITTVFGNGKPGDNLAASPIDAASNSTQIDNPTDILIDPTAPEFFTYVSDSNNNRIIKITNATNTAANVTVSGQTVVPPPGGTTAGKLNHPSGIYLHPVTRDLVIADTLNNRILVLDKLGGLTTQASCSLDASPSFALDVPKSSLVWPHAIVSESETTTTFPIFVADLFTNKVRK
ncbi:MAG: hypothetical protein FJZ00_13810, partial [Candidatus Sericytochromatia bacterium]|nr:hypothetical protein [Candidatus Tanganyikabacteria bacterium]